MTLRFILLLFSATVVACRSAESHQIDTEHVAQMRAAAAVALGYHLEILDTLRPIYLDSSSTRVDSAPCASRGFARHQVITFRGAATKSQAAEAKDSVKTRSRAVASGWQSSGYAAPRFSFLAGLVLAVIVFSIVLVVFHIVFRF